MERFFVLQVPEPIPMSEDRAGRYIQQPQAYRAFFPAELPPTPSITIDSDLLARLLTAQGALARLDGRLLAQRDPLQLGSGPRP